MPAFETILLESLLGRGANMFPEQIISRENNTYDETAKGDMTLTNEVNHALWKDDVLRALEYPEIDVRVKSGIVYLSGHIVSTTSRSRVEKALRAIPGILGIRNNLVLDDKLTLEVATSLGKLEHLYGCKFFTGASHGVISLNGMVSSEDVKRLAEKCAADNPNVRGVINNVQVSGTEPTLQEQPFLQPVIGEPIYFLDGVVGAIKQVVLNPDNRRVIQMIIQGQFSSQQQNLSAQTDGQPQQILERTVVIPVNLIRYLTKSSGFLTIHSMETTQYQDFNPLYFTSPQPDWTLPYPYRPGDVLFNVEAEEIENQKMIDPDIVQINISAQPTSAKAPEMSVDIIASWEDDGGQIIQPAEAGAILGFGISTKEIQGDIQQKKDISLVNDSLGG